MNTHKLAALVMAAIALSVVAAGCGSSSSGSKSKPAATSGPTAGYGQKAYKLLFGVENTRHDFVVAHGQKQYRTALAHTENVATNALVQLQKMRPPASAKSLHGRAIASLQKMIARLKAVLAEPTINSSKADNALNVIEFDIGPQASEALSLP